MIRDIRELYFAMWIKSIQFGVFGKGFVDRRYPGQKITQWQYGIKCKVIRYRKL